MGQWAAIGADYFDRRPVAIGVRGQIIADGAGIVAIGVGLIALIRLLGILILAMD